MAQKFTDGRAPDCYIGPALLIMQPALIVAQESH